MRGMFSRFFIAAWILFGTVLNLQVTETNLRGLLTNLEWLSLIGSSNSGSKFSIVYPHLTTSDDALVKKLEIETPEKKFMFELVPNPDLLSKNFLVFETFANGSYPMHFIDDDARCHYRGDKSALCLCNGIKGLLYFDNDSLYIIHPLPQRLHTNSSIQPHIIVVRKHNNKSCHHYHNTTLPEDIPKATKDSKAKKIKSLSRSKREVLPFGTPVFVETAVFVDRDLFEHMKTNFPVETERELIRFVLAMINAVQLLYHDPSLGRPVNFVLKRLEILKEEAAGLVRPPDIDRFLSNFCIWQRTKNPVGDREPQHWDHALILTGLDLYVRGKHGKISNQVVGLAPVAGMCTTTSSCTVNEGRHFESVYVVAHEIGHNLGMRHDGPLADNDCDPAGYIMSPTLGSGKITWSACSRRYLEKFLETSQSRCLLDHGSSAGQLDHSAEGALPGERFDADQQCMLKYGRGSRHSSQQPLDDVCRDLHCERERYTWTSHPALEGTMCSHNMWCKGGRCISRGYPVSAAYSTVSQTPSRHVEQNSGTWSKWKPYSDCASGCLFGEEGRLRSGSTGIMASSRICNNPRGSENYCEGQSKRYQACNAQQCLNVPRLTIREFAEQICTRATDVDKDLTGLGMQKLSSDPEEACLVWCQKRNGGTKSRGWTFPDGTVCQTRRSLYGKSSYCINGRCEEFVCDSFEQATFAQMPELCPVERTDNELLWRTGLRGRSNAVVKWKSASGCHFNCISPGTGVRLVMSKGKHAKSSIQLCQPDQYGCGRIKSPFQHASMICNKYKDRVGRLSGIGMQIPPAVEDPDRPCRVACQDENISHRYYLVNGEEGWFPFGTDCSRSGAEKKAYCISGKCLEFGSDKTPLSESEFTLPLLSRSRRSLELNSTRVMAKLNQRQLEQIIKELNRTLSGNVKSDYRFDIDLSNPIHVDMDMESVQYHTKKQSTDFLNYT
ncbi:A disintegrin and metalloproteinase with thrombospondin motifs adt-1 isoform X2 [Tribolium castaneum]|uniref:A disintegrin and metalloproteinase with thrombospondin motifs 16-like Protein n=1 Tax=Tribolium castaneum TaxID=7070 RepID=D6WRW7_TRICA|nr:PREDICTED: A disintegrin and metalloproteinase with thrombospondin motifs 7 isoform X2 [Tribolium castaneum]EFA06592.2 A disintegrin and metalloproteinase with thrombospondin motifs 16-like Protein [Tribolium castaneum]|eukprot:XP_008195234.1 PREDICTED: A disintegrin and metalloproteinase with thrombospondin motifs 7 isoform X2 [Tribolium castaneum]